VANNIVLHDTLANSGGEGTQPRVVCSSAIVTGVPGGVCTGERDAPPARPAPGILVTDGEERSALAVVRSLGRAGYRVHVSVRASVRGTSAIAAASRWTTGVLMTPDPLREPAAFGNAVVGYVASHAIDIVVPVTDASMLALLPVRDRLGGATIPCGTLDSFVALADKAGLRERAGRLGIAFPRQLELDWSARHQSLVEQVHMPAVVKPARTVAVSDPVDGGQAGVPIKFGVRHAATMVELAALTESMPRAAYPLLIQERIIGPGVGIFLLLWGGEIVASFAHRRLREKPPSGGVSVYAESIVPPAGLVERSSALLRDLEWNGVAMVEYKIDQATNTPYLMEINGRFWGSLQLAIDAGVDFPRLLVECAVGRPTAAPAAYQAGVRGRWWWGDVDHLLARLRGSRADLSLPPGAPSREAAVREFFRACVRCDADAVWRRDDPRPFLSETVAWFRGQ
jgi:predicted ATP-grasp superfamily ATP-dependent carboligase